MSSTNILGNDFVLRLIGGDVLQTIRKRQLPEKKIRKLNQTTDMKENNTYERKDITATIASLMKLTTISFGS